MRHPDFPLAPDAGELEDPITVQALTERASFERSDVEFVRGVYDEEIAFTDRAILTLAGPRRLDLDGEEVERLRSLGYAE